jgi:hypothetical protein
MRNRLLHTDSKSIARLNRAARRLRRGLEARFPSVNERNDEFPAPTTNQQAISPKSLHLSRKALGKLCGHAQSDPNRTQAKSCRQHPTLPRSNILPPEKGVDLASLKLCDELHHQPLYGAGCKTPPIEKTRLSSQPYNQRETLFPMKSHCEVVPVSLKALSKKWREIHQYRKDSRAWWNRFEYA